MSVPDAPARGEPPEQRRLALAPVVVVAVIGILVGAFAVLLATEEPARRPGLVADVSRGLLAPAFIFSLLALGLNLQWGHSGLFNAGIAGFFAIGAYVGAILSTPTVPPIAGPGHLGYATLFPRIPGVQVSFFVGVFAAMAFSGLAALLIAIPTLRLRADYLAIATLALSAIVVEVFRNWDAVTGGVYGIQGIPRPWEFGGEVFRTEAAFAAFLGLLVVFTFVLMDRATRAPWGRALKALREDEDAALALGKNTYFLKLQAFVMGSALMGAAGALYASLSRVVYPETFSPAVTFAVWVMVIVGGSGNNFGVVVGSFALGFFEYFTLRAKDWFALPTAVEDRIFYIRLIAIGALLIVLILLRPQGLLPEPRKVTRRPLVVLRWPTSLTRRK